MIKNLRARLADFFGEAKPPITENSSLQEIARECPHVFSFIERKYGIHIEPDDKVISLGAFVAKHGLPPAAIVFMEVQLNGRFETIRSISPTEAQKLLAAQPGTKFLDAREPWELKICTLPNSKPLTAEILDEILNSPDKNQPILLYCHFGVRSLDAATFLADRGFRNVHVVQGGIDAWSTQVDPNIPKYEAAYC